MLYGHVWNLEGSQKSRESISVTCSCKVENLMAMNTDTHEGLAAGHTPSSPCGDCATYVMGGLHRHGRALRREPGTGAEEVS